MRQLSSFDLHFLVQELKMLAGGRVQKIIQIEPEQLFFEFYLPKKGKIGVHVQLPSFIFFAGERPSGKQRGLGEYLTKYLLNGRCTNVSQIGLERIIRFDFSTKHGPLQVYIELFGKGNIIVCKEGVILRALINKVWKDRVIKKGERYVLPPAKLNITSITKKEFLTHYTHRKGETVSSILAIDFGMGGSYAEEVCIRALIDPKSKNYSKEQIENIFKIAQDMLQENIEPYLVKDADTIIDVTPFSFEKYKGKKQQKIESFHQGIAQVAALMQTKESPYERRIRKIRSIIAQQQKRLDDAVQEIQANTFLGDKIYQQYKEINQVLEYIKKKEKPWEAMKEELLKVKFIHSVDEKKGKLVLEFSENI